MDKGAWWATVRGGRKESDTTERVTHTHTPVKAPMELTLPSRYTAQSSPSRALLSPPPHPTDNCNSCAITD